MMPQRCRNCQAKEPLWQLNVKRGTARRSCCLCAKCKPIWDAYIALGDKDLFHLMAPVPFRSRRVPVDTRAQRGFDGTECRVDVYQFMTSPGSFPYQVAYLGFDDR